MEASSREDVTVSLVSRGSSSSASSSTSSASVPASNGSGPSEKNRDQANSRGSYQGTRKDDEDEDEETGSIKNFRQNNDSISCGIPCFPVNNNLYVTVLLCLINIFLFADQNLLAPELSTIASDFGFNEVERDRYLGGNVALVFFLVGGVTSIVVGYLSDSVNRIYTLVAIVLIGETGCLVTYWVTSYEQLLVARAVTGISVGGTVPLCYSLFGDLWPTRKRGTVVAVAGVAMGFGVGFGQIIAGITGPLLGWRTPFLIIAIPAYVLALILIMTTRDPRRGTKEEVLTQLVSANDIIYSERITCSKLKVLLSCKTVVLILLQGLPGSLPWGVMIVYFNDFLSSEYDISVELSTVIVLLYGVGIVMGQLLAGWLTDRWFVHRKKAITLGMGSATILGGVPVLFMLYGAGWLPVWAFFILTIPAGFLAGIPGSVLRTLMLNVTVPEVRGSAFAILNLVDDLGRGLGPFFVSFIIEAMPDRRRDALAISVSGWLICGLMLGATVFTLDSDVRSVDKRILHNYLKRHPGESTEYLVQEYLLEHNSTDREEALREIASARGHLPDDELYEAISAEDREIEPSRRGRGERDVRVDPASDVELTLR